MEITYDTQVMKAIPAYELFCELAQVLGQDWLTVALMKKISVHFLVCKGCEQPAKLQKIFSKLIDASFSNIMIDGVLHMQQDLSMRVWCRLVDAAIELQYGDFFLDLQEANKGIET